MSYAWTSDILDAYEEYKRNDMNDIRRYRER